MKLPRNILLLLPTIFVISCYEASSLFHPLSVASSSSSSLLYWSTRRLRQNRHITFMIVPRGGSDTYDHDIDANVSDADDPTENDLHDDCLKTDQFDNDTENNTDEDDYYVASYENEKDDYDHLPARIDPNILSPAHLTSLFLSAAHHRQSLTSAVVHYASLVIRATRRACLAGARAVMSMEVEDEGCKEQSGGASGSEESASEPKRGGAGNKPMVHTLIERTVHVLGEMYHAAVTSDDGSDVLCNEMADGNDENNQLKGDEDEESCLGRKRNRRRRRRSRRTKRRRHHRHRHHDQQYISTPPKAIKVISNGGGMDPSPSYSRQDAVIQLAKLYKTKLSVTDDDANRPSLSNKYDSILLSSQTSINEALQMANSNARFLICYISKRSNKSNTVAIPNLLSPEIVKLANRKALGKKQTGEYASFYIWIANDDAHVDAAMKRLGVKPLKQRQSSTKKKPSSSKSSADVPPILAIIYPATTIDPSSGRPRISSRVLAQHHCNPPPTTTEILTSWANSVRKRHLREYAKLQHACTELRLLKERNRGYVGSIQEDEAREAKESEQRKQKEEEEANERDRLRQIEERRQALLESLAEEPPMGTTPSEDVITIALRFNDGNKRDQRRFLADKTRINDVCNWIDARHGIEREKLELSTMNGARKFVYVENSEEDMTLREAGLAKMTALRVAEVESAVADKEEEDEIVDEEAEAVEEKEEDAELDEDDEEEEDDEDEDEDEEE